jgi:hypothetical protein
MKRTIGHLAALVAVVVAWEVGFRPLLVSPALGEPVAEAKDSEELAKLYAEDQADRMPKDGKAINWAAVGPRDKARLARVKELYQGGKLQTGADYFHAAMVLQHAEAPGDYLLAHELCIVAVGKGNKPAKWLAAASEDRFLMNIGRPQRFGTQYRAEGGGAFRLYKVEEGVTDGLRKEFGAPSLEEAKKREEKFNEKAEPKKDRGDS